MSLILFFKSIFALLGTSLVAYLGVNYEQKKQLKNDLKNVRQIQKRRASRDSDSIDVVTDRLRMDAREE